MTAVRRVNKPKSVKRMGLSSVPGYQMLGSSNSPSEDQLEISEYGLEDAMSPATMQEWAISSERGVKRMSDVPMFTPAQQGSPTKRVATAAKLSPSENPADQSDLNITFSAMGEGLDEAMMDTGIMGQ